jgi:hypothetical protein
MNKWIRIASLAMIVAALASCAKTTATPTVAPVGAPTSAPTQAAEKPTASAALQTLSDTFFAALLKEDWEAATKTFNEAMLKAMPPDKLAATWQALQKQVGGYQKALGARVERQGQYEALITTLQFEKMALDMRVTMDVNTGQMAGLFFTPAQTAAQPTLTFGAPTYANSASFEERDVTVGQGEWALPGTLTLPKGAGPFPAIVLVHGSGPNDRDETIGPNKPFRDLAWGLASQGIAVLRYDKRTLTHGQKLTIAGSEITVKEESIDDALAAAALLRQTANINPDKVFVLGHSLGGMLAPRIGQADQKLAGLVILAGATTPLEDLMLVQTKYILSLDGSISAEDQQTLDELAKQVEAVKKLTASSTEGVLGAPAGYWLDLRDYKPAELAKTLKQPLLILQGERDYQVTMSDFQVWKDALAGQANVQFKSYVELNHLFIAGQGKSSPQEYEQAGHVAEAVVKDIAAWIKAR